jgi:hypothetical protein
VIVCDALKTHEAGARASPGIAARDRAKLHGVNPHHYLRAAILAADRGDVLLPWDMLRAA